MFARATSCLAGRTWKRRPMSCSVSASGSTEMVSSLSFVAFQPSVCEEAAVYNEKFATRHEDWMLCETFACRRVRRPRRLQRRRPRQRGHVAVHHHQRASASACDRVCCSGHVTTVSTTFSANGEERMRVRAKRKRTIRKIRAPVDVIVVPNGQVSLREGGNVSVCLFRVHGGHVVLTHALRRELQRSRWAECSPLLVPAQLTTCFRAVRLVRR